MVRSLVVVGVAFSVACFVSVGVAACGGITSSGGGGSTGAGSVSGTVGSISFAVADVVAVAESGTPGVDARSIQIDLFDIPNVCALVQTFPNNSDKASYTALELRLSVSGSGSSSSAIVAGTYTLGPITGGPRDGGTSVHASANLAKNDAQCNSVVPSQDRSATGGTITITSISATSVEGSYAVTFADGTMSGSFNAAFCTLPDRTKTPPSDAGTSCVP